MAVSLLRTNKELAEIYDRHFETVYRVCYTYMKNAADTEDLVHDTFCKLMETGQAFESQEHEKAWLIRTSSNLCKNKLKHWWRRHEDIETCAEVPGDEKPETSEVLDAVLRLPEKYKTMIYSYYYEGYSSAEIANLLKVPHSTVRVYLQRARKMLKKQLGGDLYEN